MLKEPDGNAIQNLLPKGVIRDNLELACFALILILFFKTFVMQNFAIPSGSMRNTLMIGDHLLVNKFIYARPQWAWENTLFPMRNVMRGDIISFRYPLSRDKDFVKRCVAIPGDKVEIRQKRLYINEKLVTGEFEHHILKEGEQPIPGPWPVTRNAGKSMFEISREMARMGYMVDQPVPWPFLDTNLLKSDREGKSTYQGTGSFYFRDDIAPFVVPADHVMAMGDNRDNSSDSRFWGFVPVDHLRSRPFLIWWSHKEGGRDDQNAKEIEGPASLLSSYLDGIRYFFTRSRWNRIGAIPR